MPQLDPAAYDAIAPVFTFRLNSTAGAELRKAASKDGLTPSEYVRQVVVEHLSSSTGKQLPRYVTAGEIKDP